MSADFPNENWVNRLREVLNTDERYAEVAKNWEGDLTVYIDPDEGVVSSNLPVIIYLDLWHGVCREAAMIDPKIDEAPSAAFVLRAPLNNILKIFSGELDPIQAMLTRRLKVEGNLAYMLRNVPTVLDFVRCCRIVEAEFA